MKRKGHPNIPDFSSKRPTSSPKLPNPQQKSRGTAGAGSFVGKATRDIVEVRTSRCMMSHKSRSRFVGWSGFASAALALLLASQTAHAQSTVILVRHGEKAARPADDPPLTKDGERRARDLAATLADARVSMVIATQFVRSQETAKPVCRCGASVRDHRAGDGRSEGSRCSGSREGSKRAGRRNSGDRRAQQHDSADHRGARRPDDAGSLRRRVREPVRARDVSRRPSEADSQQVRHVGSGGERQVHANDAQIAAFVVQGLVW